jgi:hypothetical protein
MTPDYHYEYWGFYLLQFPMGCDMPGPNMKLNGLPITSEQLQRHIDFKEKFCEGMNNARRPDVQESNSRI